MAEYRLTAFEGIVQRVDDVVTTIPADPANTDWIKYQAWLAAGGVPEPYVNFNDVVVKQRPK